jgi:hypothetical protein
MAFRSGSRVRLVWALLFVFACLVRAGASDTESQFWPEIDVYVHLNAVSRLYLTYSATREHDLADYANGQTGIFYDFYTLPILRRELGEHPDKSRGKLLMFRGGYTYTLTPESNGHNKIENTATFLADARVPLKNGLLLIERNRGDLRFIDGAYTPRYRNRLRLERRTQVGRLDFIPYAQVEVFYDWKYDAFAPWRYSLGSEFRLNRHIILEGNYTRQRNTKSSPEYVNALALTLQLYFRWLLVGEDQRGQKRARQARISFTTRQSNTDVSLSFSPF